MGHSHGLAAEAGKEGFFKKENGIKHTARHLSQDTLTRNLYVRVLAASPREPQPGDDANILQWEKHKRDPPRPGRCSAGNGDQLLVCGSLVTSRGVCWARSHPTRLHAV